VEEHLSSELKSVNVSPKGVFRWLCPQVAEVDYSKQLEGELEGRKKPPDRETRRRGGNLSWTVCTSTCRIAAHGQMESFLCCVIIDETGNIFMLHAMADDEAKMDETRRYYGHYGQKIICDFYTLGERVLLKLNSLQS
jgi:hypothetical protein